MPQGMAFAFVQLFEEMPGFKGNFSGVLFQGLSN